VGPLDAVAVAAGEAVFAGRQGLLDDRGADHVDPPRREFDHRGAATGLHPGVEPAPVARVATAHVRSVEGAGTGRTYRVR
jgi:hypothetical protein